MHTHICIYIHMHMYRYIFTHTFLCVYTYTYRYKNIHIDVDVCVYVHIFLDISIKVQIYKDRQSSIFWTLTLNNKPSLLFFIHAVIIGIFCLKPFNFFFLLAYSTQQIRLWSLYLKKKKESNFYILISTFNITAEYLPFSLWFMLFGQLVFLTGGLRKPVSCCLMDINPPLLMGAVYKRVTNILYKCECTYHA